MQKNVKSNPIYHAENVQTELNSLINHLREDIDNVEDPKADQRLRSIRPVVCKE